MEIKRQTNKNIIFQEKSLKTLTKNILFSTKNQEQSCKWHKRMQKVESVESESESVESESAEEAETERDWESARLRGGGRLRALKWEEAKGGRLRGGRRLRGFWDTVRRLFRFWARMQKV